MLHHILIISDGGFVANVFTALKESNFLPSVEVCEINAFESHDQRVTRLATRPSLIVLELSDKDDTAKIMDTISMSSFLKDIPLIHVKTTTRLDHMNMLELIHKDKLHFDSSILGSIDKKEMILIPAGTYKRRKGISQEYLLKNGDQQDEAHTGAFYIDKYTVTHAEYERFIIASNYAPPRSWEDGEIPQGKENHPITGVSWEDVLAYANWAGKIIPSLDEWEKAAFGKDGLNFPWGNDFDARKCNVAETNIGGTTPVDYFDDKGGGSSYGVRDMIGNAWEWVYDWISSPNNRVLCGGAWDTPREILEAPNYARVRAHPELRGANFGFRLILPLEKYILNQFTE